MASLQITYDELRREVGRFIGVGRDPSTWASGSDEETDVADSIRAGLRRFYFADLGEGQRHSWSFLRNQYEFDSVADTRNYMLPDDFGGSLLGLTYGTGVNVSRIQRREEEEIRALYGSADKSGDPQYCAITPVQPGHGASTRYEVLMYPVPDRAVSMNLRYAIEPEDLSESNIYHLGGAIHSECVLESCLAAAEKTLFPEREPIHAARFAACLAQSVKIDSEMQ